MESILSTEESSESHPAGFWVRFLAMVVDGLFFMAVGVVIGMVGRVLWGRETMSSRVMRASITAFNLLFGTGYYIFFHWQWGQTVGKMALRIRVVSEEGLPISVGTSMLRYLGYWLSALPLLIGYLMAGLRADRRALHDLIARTRVVRF